MLIFFSLENVQIAAFALRSGTQSAQSIKNVMAVSPSTNLLVNRICLSLSFLLPGCGEKKGHGPRITFF
jgi:hypothetical protein